MIRLRLLAEKQPEEDRFPIAAPGGAAATRFDFFTFRLIIAQDISCTVTIMGVVKTFSGFCLAALLAAPPALAMPDRLQDRAVLFAICAGRYSAAMEHAWLMGGDDRPAIAARGQFDDLLDAIRADVIRDGLSGPELLHTRITAKFAQARLLQLAAFHTDPATRAGARAAARRAVSLCETLVFA